MADRGLITGIAGQDGSYLAELLVAEGWEVHGTVRPGTDLWRLGSVADRVMLHEVDLASQEEVRALVTHLHPAACWHLTGTRKPVPDDRTASALLEGELATTHALLQAMTAGIPRGVFVFAASSEMYGPDAVVPQDERTPLDPRNIYAIAKAAGVHLVRYTREIRGLRACSAILFNHESPRRTPDFVSRKISLAVARIRAGLQHELELGSLDASRDWGHARCYAKALRLMACQDEPEDLVIATGVPHTVGDFVNLAFAHVGLDPTKHIVLNTDLARPMESLRVGNPARAGAVLGWSPECSFKELIAEMVDEDLRRVQEGPGRRSWRS